MTPPADPAVRRLTDALCDAGAEARRAGVDAHTIVVAYLVGAVVHAACDGDPWTVETLTETAHRVASDTLPPDRAP